MAEDVYRRLQRHLDKSPVAFPETKSGVEISFLKQLFDEEEACIALKLSALPEPLDKIHGRFRKGEISMKHLKSRLDGLFEKGAIQTTRNPEGGRKYSKVPIVVGMFEFQVDRVTKELAEDFYKYEEEGLAEELLKPKTKQMRTIPINVELDPEFVVGSYDNARAFIEKSRGPYAVMNCVCRQAKEKMGEPCKQTDIMQTCFTLGNSAIHMIRKGVAERLSKDEMLELVNRAEKEGMVLQPQNTQEPDFLCCCCGCCCGVLTAAKKYPEPAEFFLTNFYAEVDPESCTGCEACMEICQMEALVSVNSHTEVMKSHCIGCGLCINTCPTEAISLKKNDTETVPPKDRKEMYMKMVKERYGVLGSLRFMGKAVLGRKI